MKPTKLMPPWKAMKALREMKKATGTVLYHEDGSQTVESSALANLGSGGLLSRSVLEAIGEAPARYALAVDLGRRAWELGTAALLSSAVRAGRADGSRPLRQSELENELEAVKAETSPLDLLAKAQVDLRNLNERAAKLQAELAAVNAERDALPSLVAHLEAQVQAAQARIATLDEKAPAIEREAKATARKAADAQTKAEEIGAAIKASELEEQREEMERLELEKTKTEEAEAHCRESELSAMAIDDTASRARAEEEARVAELRAKGRRALAHQN